MTILDTSIWIAFLRRQPAIFEPARHILEDSQALAVECIFGELLQGAGSERERQILTSYWRHLPKAEVAELWIEAGRYAGVHRLSSRGVGLIDSAIMVCALKTGSRIWSLDKSCWQCWSPGCFSPRKSYRKSPERRRVKRSNSGPPRIRARAASCSGRIGVPRNTAR